MAKRFTDSRKWDDAWFVSLDIKHRFLWIYILDKCDHNGVYQSIPAIEKFNTGFDYDWKEVECAFGNRVIPLVEKCYFIPKFIKFQYSGLRKRTPLYNKIRNFLKDKDLLKYVKLENDEENHSDATVVPECHHSIGIGIGNGNGKEQGIGEPEFDVIWQEYPNRIGRKAAIKHFLASVITKDDLNNVYKALENYKNSSTVKKGYIQNGSTWFNNWQDWVSVKSTNEYEDVK